MKVNLNTAPAEELRAVGFSRAAVEGIMEYRSLWGYKNVAELLRTRHIGVKTYEKMFDKVCVGDEVDCRLYEKRMGDRREYRYGPAWVMSMLWIEGGYPTPEEAKLAWLRSERSEEREERERNG